MSSEAAADELLRALGALQLSQHRWLADLGEVLAGDPAFNECFRRWQEQLTMVKLQLHRTEGRLLHYLPAALSREPREPRGRGPAIPRALAATWRTRLEAWFTRIHLPTAYRRLEDPLDLDQEAVTADIITDFASLAECAESTLPALDELRTTRDAASLESTAFFRVVAPWKRLGLPALLDCQRWIAATLAEQEDW